jgi:MFS family permease
MSAIPGAAMPLRLRMALLSAIGLLEAMVFGLTHPIYALNLQQQDFSESEIGFNATLGGLGVFLVGPFVPWLIARAGYRNYTVFCFLAAAASIGALAAGPGFAGWCVSRLLLGMALGSLWILTEAWLNEIVPDAARGRANSVFQFCYSIGFMAGPGLVMAVGFAGGLPIAFMVVMALVGGIATLFLPQPTAPTADAGRLDLRVAREALPLISVAFVTGLVETALYTMLPIFGQKAGFGEQGALSLLIALSVGAITMALPIGLASDRYRRTSLLAGVSGEHSSACCCCSRERCPTRWRWPRATSPAERSSACTAFRSSSSASAMPTRRWLRWLRAMPWPMRWAAPSAGSWAVAASNSPAPSVCQRWAPPSSASSSPACWRAPPAAAGGRDAAKPPLNGNQHEASHSAPHGGRLPPP